MSLQLISEPVTPSALDAQLARESGRLLDAVPLGEEGTVNVALEGVGVRIPSAAARVLLATLAEMGRGHGVATVALDGELSTQEAADLLNVSRPFVVKLLDQGAIPSRMVGTHRRVLTADVLAYKLREKEARVKVLHELVAEGQRLNMGY